MAANNVNYYDNLFSKFQSSSSPITPHQLVLEAYLYRKTTSKNINKDESFWNSLFIHELPPSFYRSEDFQLVLTRYFTLTSTFNYDFLVKVLQHEPDVLKAAILKAELVLKKDHVKWHEIHFLARKYPDNLEDLIATCDALQNAHSERLNFLKSQAEPFSRLTIFEFLALSAIYSFKCMTNKAETMNGENLTVDMQLIALKELVNWKLKESNLNEFYLTDDKIALAIKIFQVPFIFPNDEQNPRVIRLLNEFSLLMQAQVELNEFISRSIHPYCFDEGFSFSLINGELVLNSESSANDNWERNGRRQRALRGYWFNRAIDEFCNSDIAGNQIGSAENHEENQFAYVKALASKIELEEVYGFSQYVAIGKNVKVNIFQAILAQELMMAFYLKEYTATFYQYVEETGHWQTALSQLAFNGLLQGENRFPITWSNIKDKINNLVGWTVCDKHPKGDKNAAKAMLDFWSVDLKEHSKLLRSKTAINRQQLTERPIFKIGNYCVQLPWLMPSQISSVNVINNLRRFANARPSLKDETSRIESKLGDAFANQGFNVLKGYTPQDPQAGEIDLICAIDNLVIIIEVKSTFYRTSKKEIVYHRDRTLRKAGIQIRNKVTAIKRELENGLAQQLGIADSKPTIVGWIADTSIEFDHEYFAGYPKVSIQEILIALSDSAHYLSDLENEILTPKESEERFTASSLYNQGFDANQFVKIIENSLVWQAYGESDDSY
ncbi:hypothetical protein [Pseudoalteromonas sp. BDTF-M6]|uniref:hypothetical protein n=1 Tax=Pseudoalteromonas sp. BDTF-M6 TaxID=2796132 RepID=UPI001BB00A2C|nr:hypothetical protein [Pseudoalteromonas sp. BDTF-M6]MBS3796650.1 hypothetical protein [Pseudoalteromonas sp. BDTF-M6]